MSDPIIIIDDSSFGDYSRLEARIIAGMVEERDALQRVGSCRGGMSTFVLLDTASCYRGGNIVEVTRALDRILRHGLALTPSLLNLSEYESQPRRNPPKNWRWFHCFRKPVAAKAAPCPPVVINPLRRAVTPCRMEQRRRKRRAWLHSLRATI